jgi:hypothetical protein
VAFENDPKVLLANLYCRADEIDNLLKWKNRLQNPTSSEPQIGIRKQLIKSTKIAYLATTCASPQWPKVAYLQALNTLTALSVKNKGNFATVNACK